MNKYTPITLVFVVAILVGFWSGYKAGEGYGETEGRSTGAMIGYQTVVNKAKYEPEKIMITPGPVELNCTGQQLRDFSVVVIPQVQAISIKENSQVSITDSNFIGW